MDSISAAGMALHLSLCLVAVVALVHLLAGRIPDWLFVFLPCIFFVPDLFYMELQWGTAPDWIGALSTAFGAAFVVYAYSKWKSQLVASKQFEVAVEYMRNLSELEWMHFKVCSAPAGEQEAALARLNEFDTELLDVEGERIFL